MKKEPNRQLEFVIFVSILALAIVFGYTFDLNWFKSAPKEDEKEEVEKKDGEKPRESPEALNWKKGKDLFKTNCAACHNPKADGTGPALLGVTERWKAAGDYQGKTGEQWLHLWIKNWNEPVNAGYKYAMDMANTRPSMMNTFSNLKDEDIDLILQYANRPNEYNRVVN